MPHPSPSTETVRGKPSAARLEKLYDQRRSLDTYKNAASSNWTDERVERLKALWADGLSCSQIAAELGGGLTRNSVIGKANRLKLPPRLSKSPFANKASRVPGIARNRSKLLKKQSRVKKGFIPGAQLPLLPEALPGDVEALQGDAWAALPGTSPKPLAAVSEARGCRWPIGEDRPFLFCGEPTHKGVYCAAPHAIAFRPHSPPTTRRVKSAGGVNIRDLEEA